jgi:hypothetical protein
MQMVYSVFLFWMTLLNFVVVPLLRGTDLLESSHPQAKALG